MTITPYDKNEKHMARSRKTGEEVMVNAMEMVTTADYWPDYPFLPLKSRIDGTLGVLYAKKDKTVPIVVFGNMFVLPSDYEDFKKIPRIHFDSFKELLTQWNVD